jgi:cytochrome c biogenesis protein CcdA
VKLDGALVGYALTIGLTGLINPCGLPLLPAYLALFIDGVDRPWPSRLWAALRSGGSLMTGFVGVFGVAGLAEAWLTVAVTDFAPWLMLVVGAGILVLGVLSLTGTAPALHLPGLSFRPGRGALAMIGFGAAYAVGSISCSLPIFIAAVGSTLATAVPLQSVAVFIAYALGMGLFATAASVIAAFGGATALHAFRPLARALPRIAGGVCVLVGLYLVGYWAHVLGAPDAIAALAAVVDGVQSALVSWLDAWWLPATIGCCTVVLAALVALAASGDRRTPAGASRTGDRRS